MEKVIHTYSINHKKAVELINRVDIECSNKALGLLAWLYLHTVIYIKLRKLKINAVIKVVNPKTTY